MTAIWALAAVLRMLGKYAIAVAVVGSVLAAMRVPLGSPFWIFLVALPLSMICTVAAFTAWGFALGAVIDGVGRLRRWLGSATQR